MPIPRLRLSCDGLPRLEKASTNLAGFRSWLIFSALVLSNSLSIGWVANMAKGWLSQYCKPIWKVSSVEPGYRYLSLSDAAGSGAQE